MAVEINRHLFSKEVMHQINIQIIAILLTALEYAKSKDRLLTEPEVGVILGVSSRTLRRWRKAKVIDHIEYEGGDIRYRPEHIDDFLNKRDTGILREERRAQRQQQRLRVLSQAS